MDSSTKKGKEILILKILEEYSDENHPLKQKEIAELVKDNYGLNFDRRTISTGLKLLNELGYEIEGLSDKEYEIDNRKGVYLSRRILEKDEITYLAHILFSLKTLSAKQTMKLINSLSSTLSKYDQEDYKWMKKCNEINKTNKPILYNIIDVNEAIKNKKKIKFKYYRVSYKNKETDSRGGLEYIVSPYFTFHMNGRDYILCSIENRNRLVNFRLDKLKDIEILKEKRIELKDLHKSYKDFTITKYLNTHVYPFNGEIIKVKLEIMSKEGTRYLKDYFENHIKFYEENNKMYAEIENEENAIFCYLMQYGTNFKVVSPDSLAKKIKETSKTILDYYK